MNGTVKIEDGEWNRDMEYGKAHMGGKIAGMPTSFQLKASHYGDPVSCSGFVSTVDDGSHLLSGATRSNWVGGGSDGEGEFAIVLVPCGE